MCQTFENMADHEMEDLTRKDQKHHWKHLAILIVALCSRSAACSSAGQGPSCGVEKSDSSESIDSGFGECREFPSIESIEGKESPSIIGEYKESPSISSNLSLKSILRQGLSSSPDTDTTKKKARVIILTIIHELTHMTHVCRCPSAPPPRPRWCTGGCPREGG